MRNPARSFKELVVWQKAHQFVLDVYRFTQIRRAAISVPANIAEGFPKRGKYDKTRFFNIAQGSLEEVHYYLILAKDLGYGERAHLLLSYNEIGRLPNACVQAILTPIS